MSNNTIVLDKVTKKIHGSTVLDNISLTIPGGQVSALVGINGSGKTMLLRTISGLMGVSGRVTIGDQQVKLGHIPTKIGAMIEYPGFIDEFSGAKNLELLSLLDNDRLTVQGDIKRVMTAVGLDPEDKRLYRKYSLGMKERLGIAQAIIGNPQVVLLDEPTNALDMDGVKLLVKLIHDLQANEVTVIVASHEQEFVKQVAKSSNIFHLEKGRIVEG